MQDDAADEVLMKSKSNESKVEMKLEARKTEETDKAKKSGGKAKNLRRWYTS